MTDDRIEALRELLRKATQGPWYVETDRSEGEYGRGPDTTIGYDVFEICAEGGTPFAGQRRVLFDSHNSTIIEIEEDQHCDEYGHIDAWDAIAKANAHLIVAAVNALPELLDRLERVRRDTLEEAAAAADALDRSGREWVADSLWANIKADTAAAIRALARKEG